MWYLLFILIGLLLVRPTGHGDNRRAGHDGTRRIANGLILLTLLLGVSSTPLVEILLERSLRLDRIAISGSTPEFMIVLGGGYTTSSSPEEAVMNTVSAQRVRHAINEWRLNTDARLIFSGAGKPPHEAVAELMARAAASNGVPDSLIMLEPLSSNTREHPVEALHLPGVTSTSHVAVVTSGWNTRRARREFCRHFERVDVYPVPPAERVGALESVVPQGETLSSNARLLGEWFGIVWSVIRGIGAESVGDC